jgi:nucleotide-binding universal stress UspA family protein
MVPLDGNRFAEAALPIAMRMSRRGRGPLRLVIVHGPPDVMTERSHWVEEMKEWEHEREEHRQRYMAELARRVEAVAQVPVTIEHLAGRPAEELLDWIAREDPEMVVLSTHGRGPVTRAWMGSAADRIARKAKVPVLLVRPLPDAEIDLVPARPFRRVMIPLDGSPLAEAALQQSFLVRDEPVELDLLHVVGLPQASDPTVGIFTPPPSEQVLEAERRAAAVYLDSVARRIADWGCTVATHVVQEASPWAGIVNFPAGHGVDLIAMTTHGRGGAARMFLGSVADKVVRCATVPVLLFHG